MPELLHTPLPSSPHPDTVHDECWEEVEHLVGHTHQEESKVGLFVQKELDVQKQSDVLVGHVDQDELVVGQCVQEKVV